MRIEAAARRAKAHQAVGQRAAAAICDHLLATFNWPIGCVVAGYWPMGDELDLRPFLDVLNRGDCVTALPVVVARDAPLVFRRWAPGDPLEPGVFGTSQPAPSAPEVEPLRLLVPLLAFDRDGYRLGYGAGYYDRTIAALRTQSRAVRTIGIAYSRQAVRSVPHGEWDQRLDWVVTERGLASPWGDGGDFDIDMGDGDGGGT